LTARPSDPLRRLRYLDAMGIQVWRLRSGGQDRFEGEADGRAEQMSDASTEPAPSLSEAAVCEPDRQPPITQGASSSGSAPATAPSAADTCAGTTADPAQMDWEALRRAVAGCRACGLCETRTQTVFGVGDTSADLMVIGEAPGADEDRQGEPFVGRAGKLLDLMLAAIGLHRSRVYIANILKCRPPGNRDPRPEESAACRAFLMRQIALVRPRVVLLAGRVSAQNLLETDAPVGRLRGRWFELDPDSLPVTVTYHPSYLLRSPEQKARAWQDLQRVAQKLSED
jgi:DNA polymerase